MFTFNGHSYDLTVIRKQLGIDLREKYESCDLRTACGRGGLAGGQKVIEKRTGFVRKLEGVDGKEAVRLWEEYATYGSKASLKKLKQYNAEDLAGLIHIRKHARSKGLLD